MQDVVGPLRNGRWFSCRSRGIPAEHFPQAGKGDVGKQPGHDAQAVGDVTFIAAALQVEVEGHEGIEAVDGRFFGILALQRFDTVPDLAQFEAVPPRYQCVLSDKLMMSGSLAAEPFLFFLPFPLIFRHFLLCGWNCDDLRLLTGAVVMRRVGTSGLVVALFCFPTISAHFPPFPSLPLAMGRSHVVDGDIRQLTRSGWVGCCWDLLVFPAIPHLPDASLWRDRSGRLERAVGIMVGEGYAGCIWAGVSGWGVGLNTNI